MVNLGESSILALSQLRRHQYQHRVLSSATRMKSTRPPHNASCTRKFVGVSRLLTCPGHRLVACVHERHGIGDTINTISDLSHCDATRSTTDLMESVCEPIATINCTAGSMLTAAHDCFAVSYLCRHGLHGVILPVVVFPVRKLRRRTVSNL